jgi:hypothetical protein
MERVLYKRHLGIKSISNGLPFHNPTTVLGIFLKDWYSSRSLLTFYFLNNYLDKPIHPNSPKVNDKWGVVTLTIQ